MKISSLPWWSCLSKFNHLIFFIKFILMHYHWEKWYYVVMEICKQKTFLWSKFHYHGNSMQLLTKFIISFSLPPLIPLTKRGVDEIYTINCSNYHHLITLTKRAGKEKKILSCSTIMTFLTWNHVGDMHSPNVTLGYPIFISLILLKFIYKKKRKVETKSL